MAHMKGEGKVCLGLLCIGREEHRKERISSQQGARPSFSSLRRRNIQIQQRGAGASYFTLTGFYNSDSVFSWNRRGVNYLKNLQIFSSSINKVD